MADITQSAAYKAQEMAGVPDQWYPDAGYINCSNFQFRVKKNMFWTAENLSTHVGANTRNVRFYSTTTNSIVQVQHSIGAWFEIKLIPEKFKAEDSVRKFEEEINNQFEIKSEHIGKNNSSAKLTFKFRLIHTTTKESSTKLMTNIGQITRNAQDQVKSKHIFLKIALDSGTYEQRPSRDDKIPTKKKLTIVTKNEPKEQILQLETDWAKPSTKKLKQKFVDDGSNVINAITAHEHQQRFLLHFKKAVEQHLTFVREAERKNEEQLKKLLESTQEILKVCINLLSDLPDEKEKIQAKRFFKLAEQKVQLYNESFDPESQDVDVVGLGEDDEGTSMTREQEEAEESELLLGVSQTPPLAPATQGGGSARQSGASASQGGGFARQSEGSATQGSPKRAKRQMSTDYSVKQLNNVFSRIRF